MIYVSLSPVAISKLSHALVKALALIDLVVCISTTFSDDAREIPTLLAASKQVLVTYCLLLFTCIG